MFVDFSTSTEQVNTFGFKIPRAIIYQGKWKTKDFISLSFLLVHLPSLHDWGAIFSLTFLQPGKIGNGKSLWKAELVQDNISFPAVVKQNHRTRRLNIKHDLFHFVTLPVPKFNENLMRWQGYYAERCTEISVGLTWPSFLHTRGVETACTYSFIRPCN